MKHQGLCWPTQARLLCVYCPRKEIVSADAECFPGCVGLQAGLCISLGPEIYTGQQCTDWERLGIGCLVHFNVCSMNCFVH